MLKSLVFDFIFISETWLNSSYLSSLIIDIDLYTLYRNDRLYGRGGGVAIIAKNKYRSLINVIDVDPSDDFELISLDFYTNSHSFIRFICLYLSPTNSNNIQIVQSLVKTLIKLTPKNNVNKTLYLVGDFNFNGISWKNLVPISSNKAFLHFNDFLQNFNLSQLIQRPTHLLGNTLDFFITSDPSKVLEINITNPFSSTCDHFKIEIKLCTGILNSSTVSQWYNFKNADYSKINLFLKNQNWDTLLSQNKEINNRFSDITKIIHSSIQQYVPIKYPRKKIKLPKNIRIIQKKKNHTYKLIKENPNLKQTYKELSIAYKKAVYFYHKNNETRIMQSSNKKLFFNYIKKN